MSRYNPSLEVLKQVYITTVKEAEKSLGFKFDPELIDYLNNPVEEESGSYCEYVGLIPSSYRNVVSATEGYIDGINEGLPAFPEKSVVIAVVGNGDCYFWNTVKKKIGYYAHDDEVEYPTESYVKNFKSFIDYAFKEQKN